MLIRCAIIALALTIGGCVGFTQMDDAWCSEHPDASRARCWDHIHHPAAQSFDQANLKRNDNGCPTAIYVAPGGVLQQCPPWSTP